ncbi:DarT ssDNA thymidine ADP-ribosyltransferase family protein [Campylobacter armoricus]|nr:DarT ssDNA thymidine ADP-ribosyltransferase family protein [Campylobacter armoricus]
MSSEALFIQDSMGGFDEYGTPNFIKNTKNFYDNYDNYDNYEDYEDYEDLQVFLDARGIEFLVHFTDSRNIPSIWKYGILSRKRLDELGFTYCSSDEKRLDNKLNYISLSITSYNKPLYEAYKQRGAIRDGVLIYIDASILYKKIITGYITHLMLLRKMFHMVVK